MDTKTTLLNLIQTLGIAEELAESVATDYHSTDYDVTDIIKTKINASIDNGKLLCNTYDDGTGFHFEETDGFLQFTIDMFHNRYAD